MNTNGKTEVIEALSKSERRRLAELESEITEGLSWYERAGKALEEIRDSKLYRESHATFADYVAQKWDVTVRRAYQLMEASTAAENVKKITHLEIPNESVARAFSNLPDKKTQVRVAKKLQKSEEKVTAQSVEKIAESLKMAPRGGLYAASTAAKAKSKSSSSSEDHSHNGNGHYKVCAKCRMNLIAEIDEWYLENKKQLNEYPAAIPEVVIKKLVKALTL